MTDVFANQVKISHSTNRALDLFSKGKEMFLYCKQLFYTRVTYLLEKALKLERGQGYAFLDTTPNAELMAALILLPCFKRLRLFLKETLQL